MKSRYVFNNGQVIYAEEDGVVKIDITEKPKEAGFYVINDCSPFQSMIDGSIINSKSIYRDHLRQHGCIEVGNDRSVMNPVRKPLESPPGLKETLIRVVNERLR